MSASCRRRRRLACSSSETASETWSGRGARSGGDLGLWSGDGRRSGDAESETSSGSAAAVLAPAACRHRRRRLAAAAAG